MALKSSGWGRGGTLIFEGSQYRCFAIFMRKYRKETRNLDVTRHLVPLGTAVFGAQNHVDPLWS